MCARACVRAARCCLVDAAAEGRAAHQPEHPPCARSERWLTTLLHCAALPELCIPLTGMSCGPPRVPQTCVAGATAVSMVSAWPMEHGTSSRRVRHAHHLPSPDGDVPVPGATIPTSVPS